MIQRRTVINALSVCYLVVISILPMVNRFELAAIDGNERIGKQFELLVQHHKLMTYQADRFAIILADLAMVLKSGVNRPVNHINSISRCASRAEL